MYFVVGIGTVIPPNLGCAFLGQPMPSEVLHRLVEALVAQRLWHETFSKGLVFCSDHGSRTLPGTNIVAVRMLWFAVLFPPPLPQTQPPHSSRRSLLLLCPHVVLCFSHGPLNGSGTVPEWILARRQYLASLYWTIATLMSVGYGDISADNNRERMFALVTMVSIDRTLHSSCSSQRPP